MKRNMRTVIFALLLSTAGTAVLFRGDSFPARPPVDALSLAESSPERAAVIPDRFLRRWDPITIFFPGDPGIAGGGPEDRPGRYARINPDHPGSWKWVDSATLQFRPADPWPALTRFKITAAGEDAVLATLMSPPLSTVPPLFSRELDPVDSVSLTFAEPLDPESLASMVSIELRPLPGVDGSGTRRLTHEDYTIKTVERRSHADPATYVINLKNAVPWGTRALLRLRLSLDDGPEEIFSELSFSTAEAFRILSAGTGHTQLPVTPTGSRYGPEQMIEGYAGGRSVFLDFSAAPRTIGPVEGRNLVRFTPAVEGLSFQTRGRRLEVSGNFHSATLYRLTLIPTDISDTRGRSLSMEGESEISFSFPPLNSYLRWGAGQSLLERFGPQMLPLEGRGEERVDLRVYPVDPLDRSFWPFPPHPVEVDEAQRPPGPGEEPPPFTNPTGRVSARQLQAFISALGSPPVSDFVDLPLTRDGGGATFGLDLKPHLERLGGKGGPGHYLVGIRPLDSSSRRSWKRVQVTNLSLTTIEEPLHVRFLVGSLSDAAPVSGAAVKVEASVRERQGSKVNWATVFEGVTDAEGSLVWNPPGDRKGRVTIRRITVTKGEDTLILDPERGPEKFAANLWAPTGERWLQWTQQHLAGRGEPVQWLVHLFPERPVYRPDEEVYLKGYLRRRHRGELSIERKDGFLIVEGPGGMRWRYPVKLSAAGSFAHTFKEEKLPTGVYTASLEVAGVGTYGMASFKIEAYRIPRFEALLHAPKTVPLDSEFQISLSAEYYAGGRVAGRPVNWRVTQYPYTWNPGKRKGYFYSSDGRFSRTGRFKSTPRLQRQDVTDEEGTAALTLNPAIEPTAQPRTYVVEATVTGADDQTVTATEEIRGLPPFVLGLKVPRYIEKAKKIDAEIIAVGPDGELLPGQEITVRLLHRQWHSVLQAGDFSEGAAKYVTDVVDEKVREETVTSEEDPVPVTFPVDEAGVYVVELEARDRLDRAQSVAVDLFAGGEEPVAWPKPEAGVFTVTADREKYDPGERAVLVLRSPFQEALALVVVEAPAGNRYSWLKVEKGQAVFELQLEKTFVPRVPVHAVLFRGRLPDSAPMATADIDLGKPITLASTSWVEVTPVEQRVNVAFEHKEQALPGEEIDVTVRLSDVRGEPLSGEVTLWLVDQAVLALGEEQPLDPLPAFIPSRGSYLEVRDTRGLVSGKLLFKERIGGGARAKRKALLAEKEALLDRVTVRRRFKTVPYYNPALAVSNSGEITVKVQLPDNLTNFKLRAKAVNGSGRFGYGTGHLEVRLPLIVQPALPRFVRPGDRFLAAAIGRVVEGEGGAGRAEMTVDGGDLKAPGILELSWVPNEPARIEFPVDVPTPRYDREGRISREEIVVKAAVERDADGASDGFEVRLPLRDDRERVVRSLLADLEPNVPAALPPLEEKARSGSVKRTIFVSDQPALVKMGGAVSFLISYPYGCTEQKVSRARVHLAMKRFRTLLHLEGGEELADRAVEDTLVWIESAIQPSSGLAAYWPGGEGRVSLTAWVLQFLVEAREAGYQVEGKLFEGFVKVLTSALRSDYSRFIDGEAFTERSMALSALASAGRYDRAYVNELFRKSQFLTLEGKSQVLLASAGDSADAGLSASQRKLAGEIWDGVLLRLHQGSEIYGGLQEEVPRSGLILPGETRTVAAMTRALSRGGDPPERLQLLVDALVRLGREDGWGTTNANASALLALSEFLRPPLKGTRLQSVQVVFGEDEKRILTGPKEPVGYLVSDSEEGGKVILETEGGRALVRAETSYLPAGPGSEVEPSAQGFVVSRELLRIEGEDQPAIRIPLDTGGLEVNFTVSEVVEEHVQVVNPEERHYVAVVVPLAAGMEPLNPALATAPPEAKPRGTLTLTPTYTAFLDDAAAFYYDTLPKGTYDFYFRTRAAVSGSYIQPPAKAEMMYDGAVRGRSAGARVNVTAGDGNR